MIETPLLRRLYAWAQGLVAAEPSTPRIVLLVGGPGNGKTEAVEATILAIDRLLGLNGRLGSEFESQFMPRDGSPVPRLARADLAALSGGRVQGGLSIVQDASVKHAESVGVSPAGALVQDLEDLALTQDHSVYLACVNRGVLDHALIESIDRGHHDAQQLLEAIIRSVALSPGAPPCWPLQAYPHVAVWPMDVETLVASQSGGEQDSPASQLLIEATRPEKWPTEGTCAGGSQCPFCTSRELLGRQSHREAMLRILRWYELATGKRWSFRDLFSLISFSLAGVAQHEGDLALAPCEWAARQTELLGRSSSRAEAAKLRVPFVLVAAQYQHALFGRWPRLGGRWFRNDLKELRLDNEPTLLGLNSFLSVARTMSIPATLEAQLAGLCDALDPAVADPDTEVDVSTRKTLRFREIDARFSQSVGEGFRFVRPYLSTLEVDLMSRLEQADDKLSDTDVRRRRPAIAKRVQVLVRDFACRLVRRSLGVRAGVVRECRILDDFAKVVGGNDELLHDAVKQVEGLLNQRERFVVTLNTTFGEPLPPEPRRAVLTTGKQKVKAKELPTPDRPPAAVRFLLVGTGSAAQPIPLTYELFRSVRELKLGMLPASLPRPVVALLDTTRARLAGRVVRDAEALDGAEIRLGKRSDVIARELGKFVVRQEDAE